MNISFGKIFQQHCQITVDSSVHILFGSLHCFIWPATCAYIYTYVLVTNISCQRVCEWQIWAEHHLAASWIIRTSCCAYAPFFFSYFAYAPAAKIFSTNLFTSLSASAGSCKIWDADVPLVCSKTPYYCKSIQSVPISLSSFTLIFGRVLLFQNIARIANAVQCHN